MKELELHNPDTVSIVTQKEVEKQLKYSHSIRLKKGHTLYEFSFQEGKYQKAAYKEVLANLDGSVTKKLIQKENCIYISALNEKNLIKKLKNIKFEVPKI